MKRHFEYRNDGSEKFWEVSCEGCDQSVTFGKIGTTGQTKNKSFASPELALKETEALIRSKLAKGYVEISSQSKPAAKTETKAAPPTNPKPDTSKNAKSYKFTKKLLDGDQREKLIAAIRDGDLTQLEAFLSAGVSLDDLSSSLTWAVKPDHRHICELLVNLGAVQRIDKCARVAAECGNNELVGYFLAHGADLNRVEEGRSLLKSAAGAGHVTTIEFLFNQGSIKKAITASAMTIAAQENKREAITCLIAHGVSINAVDDGGRTVIYSAAGRGNNELIDWLIERGADVKGKSGAAAMRWALERGHKSTANKLAALSRAGNQDAAQSFTSAFAFLCSTDEDRALLNRLAATVEKVSGAPDAPTFAFENGDLACTGPHTGKFRADLPPSFNDIAKHFGSISWDAGGPEMGYPGLDEDGTPCVDGGSGLDALKHGDKKNYSRMSKADAEGAFACGQNWILFDPTRRKKNGEWALGFVSHESCDWVEVTSADNLDYKQIFLRLMAANFLEQSELDEIYS